MKTRTIQRSPDLGLGIRMQRLPQAVQQAPQTPWWWGWMDASGLQASNLEVVWNPDVGPDLPNAYWPGLWVAVVEGAATVRWEIEFTPKVWFKSDEPDAMAEVLWRGPPISYDLPPALPDKPEALFTASFAALPDPLSIGGSDLSPWSYWAGAYYSPGFPNVPAPKLVAAGNTLSVAQDSKSMSGSLVAQAHVGGRKVGTATLDLMRVIRPVWS